MRKRTDVKSLEPAEVLRRAEELKQEEPPEPQESPRYLVEQGGFSAGFGDADFSSESEPVKGSAEKLVTLHKGRMAYGTEFYKWLCSTRKFGGDRRDLTITGFDDAGVPIRKWKVLKALPFRISGLQLKAKGNEVVMGVVVLSYERLEPEDASLLH